jgi:hypothetical protein
LSVCSNKREKMCFLHFSKARPRPVGLVSVMKNMFVKSTHETRRRALLELERRFCDNRTEVLNGSAVVKNSRGDSNAGHAPYESRVHGVHEGDLPRHPDTYVLTRGGLEALDDDEDDD